MIIWNIPQQITQGDRVNWTQTLDVYDPSFDTLYCFVRGKSSIDLTGVANNQAWDFEITEAQSIDLVPGKYKTQFMVFAFAWGKKTLGSTDLLVFPSLQNLTTLETRSADEIELEAITKAIAKLASGGVEEYRIGDRMMRYQDLEQLTKRQRELRNRIAMVKNRGKGVGRNVGIRFDY